MRYEIVAVHGERRSLFHVVDAYAPEAEQPAILRTYHDRPHAELYRKFVTRRAELWGVDYRP